MLVFQISGIATRYKYINACILNTPYHTCPKIWTNPHYNMLICLKTAELPISPQKHYNPGLFYFHGEMDGWESEGGGS